MKNVAPAIFPPNGIGDAKPANQAVLDWVHEIAALTEPENIFWCDGSEGEDEFLIAESLKENVLIELNQKKVPRSYLHRSDPNDVARVEQFTFVCTATKEEAGPTNNWSEPGETYTQRRGLLKGGIGGLAEHMLILGADSPVCQKHSVAAAFPSACGKTNFAMLIPPEHFKGWKVTTVGDDIAWMQIRNGRLHAINPENGYFGVVPGTSYKSNPNAMRSIEHDTLYTNVALTDDDDVWREGEDGDPAAHGVDWRGDGW